MTLSHSQSFLQFRFLLTVVAVFVGFGLAKGQTPIADPTGTTSSTACADTRAIGFQEGNIFTYSNTNWPACSGWGLPTNVGIPVFRGTTTSGSTCSYDNVTYNAAAPTNLAGGIACFTGNSNIHASNGATYADRPINIRMLVSVTDNGGTPMALQVLGNYVYVAIPAGNNAFKVRVEIQGYGPSSVVYATSGQGTTGITCSSNPNNQYTCDDYLNDWVGAIQLYNCMSTSTGHQSCTQFTGHTFLGFSTPPSITSVTASPASPICAGTTTTLTANGVAGTGATVNWWTGTGGTGTNLGSGTTLSSVGAGTYYAQVTGACPSPAEANITIALQSPAAPTSVTASPSSFCIASNTIQLNATAAGSTIHWYTVPSGGSNIGTSASGANFTVNPTSTTTYYAEAVHNTSGCTSTTRVAVTTTFVPTPATPSPILGETTFCIGATSTLSSPIATGGDITNVGGYRIHAFYSSGTIDIAQDANVEVLVVAGGGGGGMDMGGGGGGGGVIANNSFAVNAGSYTVTVGKGGRGAPPGNTAGQPSAHQFTQAATNGENSSFSTLTAIGGGRGGSSHWPYTPGGPGAAGGSGGGASGYNSVNGTGGGAATAGQGNRGGHGGGAHYSGGGGGAGGNGTDGSSVAHGGSGILNSILGTAYYWGAGGGGAGHSTNGGNGGIGGGGGGASWNSVAGTGGASALNYGANGTPGGYAPGGNAGENTGSGGGGGSHYNSNNTGGTGGSGIVVIRYLEGAGIGQWSSSAPGVATVDPNTGVVTGVSAGTTTISYTVTQGVCSSTPVTTTVTILPDPSAPTASSIAICAGQSGTISATSAGNLIKWYDAATGGNLVGVTASGETLSVTPGSTTTYYAEAISNNPYATGGTVTTSGAYRIHRFDASGTLDFLVGGKTEVLIVGGGGGGGSEMGGGGGAGGVIQNNSFTVAAGSFPITVGGGGNGAPAGRLQPRGSNGGNSIFSTLTAFGGGGGGSCYENNNSPPGTGNGVVGSGGGVAGNAQITIGVGTPGQGYNGGSSGGVYFPSGGGGAGGSGMTRAAHGGPGIVSSILGTDYFFGGGGGGAGYSGNGGNGGKGGGGGGAVGITLGGTGGLTNGSPGTYGSAVAWAQVPGGNAAANTGGGGGGGSHYNSNNYGGNGGSGIVVVRYIDDGCSSSTRTPVVVTVNPLPNDITPTVSAQICNNTGTDVQIAGSQVGVNYQLRNDAGNVNIGSAVAGTGGTINLPTGNLTSATTFNVLATFTATSCSLEMTTTVTVSLVSEPPAIPITGLTTVCQGGTIALDGPDAYGTAPTGGSISYVDGDRIHTFTSGATLTTSQALNARVLVVAGGGGGGMDMGGGGGGGGVLYDANYTVPSGNTAVTVGAGGTGAPAAGTGGQPGSHQYTIPATSGGNSIFGTMTAIGGGFGGSSVHTYTPGFAGGAGGSGGGSSGYNAVFGTGGGAGTAGQGNVGGGGGQAHYSGGGGGAGGAGVTGNRQANGGPGILNDILGTAYYWAGGGGGAGYSIGGGNGGIGGGGGGAVGVTTGGAGYNNGSAGTNGCTGCWAQVPGGDAGANTGGGGGGGSHYNSNNKGGEGGSGIVVVRYPDVATGVWSSNNTSVATVSPTGVVTGHLPGTATISYTTTNTFGCSTTVSELITVEAPPAAPSATATPSTICLGESSNLNATSAGNLIQWYTTSTGGTPFTFTDSGDDYTVTPGVTTTYYAEAVSEQAGDLEQTFEYTGSAQTFTVPTGVTSVTIDMYGAQGGNNQSSGGLGGRTQGTLAVNPGDVLTIYVGGQDGFNGGGAPGSGGVIPGANGGGASDVRLGGVTLNDRVIVAGGGGGGGSSGQSWGMPGPGGSGGGLTGGTPTLGGGWIPPTGGTQSGGGVVGISCNNCGNTATNGSLGQGGQGDNPCSNYGAGSGGGGGYYGGAGGESCGNGEPGAGGSSYYGGVTGGSTTQGVNSGNGSVTISWSGLWDCNSSTRTPVTVTVIPLPAAPSPATATPTTVCQFESTVLNATSAGNTIRWYDAATGGTLLGTSASGANISLPANDYPTTTFYAEALDGSCSSSSRTAVVVTTEYMPSTIEPLTGEQNIICGGTTVFSNQPTGGVVTTSGGDRIHTFLSSGTFSVPSSLLGTVEVLVVGGGGGGGSEMGGGGGGGGVIYNASYSVTPGSNIAVTVGAGGEGAPGGESRPPGSNGGNSVFSTLTAFGGGGGGSDYNDNAAPPGGGNGVVGSGGGNAGCNNNTQAVGTPGQGNSGGPSGGCYYPSGGGGAGGAGSTNPANGGNGISNSILGTAYYWGAGGAGAGYSGIAGNGGLGGGGGGGPKVSGGGLAGTGGLNPGYDGSVGVLVSQTNVPGGNGAQNTGAGGGGGAHYNNGNHGGNGGSGIVVIRYPDVTNGIWSSSNTSVATVDANGVVTGVGTGTATITYQLTNGTCNSASVVTRDVTVSLPTLAPITGVTTVCAGSSSSLLVSTPKAIGGEESVVGGYRVHKFLSSGTLNVTRSGNMEVLVVAGGGGGGTNMGGGGGGGGVIANPAFPVSAGNVTVTVGAGGNGAPAGTFNNNTGYNHPNVPASNGANSAFGVLTAIGGGAGGTSPNSLGFQAGSDGGSGGGASGYNSTGHGPGDISGGLGVPGQGFEGGNQGTAYYSGGGGGAGGPGSSGNSQANGGPGVLNSILGPAYYWAGGGGGSAYSAGTGGNGGIGGGGGGAVGTTTGGAGLNDGAPGGGGCNGCHANTPGGDAGANTGGGGGGGSHYYTGNKGGDGGSGIVVVKYLDGADGLWSSSNTSVATIDANTGVVTGVAGGTATITYSVTIGSCVATQTTTVTVSDAAVSSATSTPTSICEGGTANLNAVSVGNTINWYDAATGGNLLNTGASGVNFPVTPTTTTTYYAEAVTSVTGSETFSYTGGIQSFTVPPYVTSITVDAYGAQGSNAQTLGGLGGRAQGDLAVTPGQVIYVYVGGQGGFNGGGPPGVGGTYPGAYGGGASDLRVSGIDLANRVIVAGGGGGGGTAGSSWTIPGSGGAGGGATGGSGSTCCGTPPTGGTQSAGGNAGTGCNNCGNTATNGSLGQGGRGDYACSSYGTGSGGGGGYYGGGGGESCGNGETGGGGSSYIGGVTSGTTTSGVRSGNGQITISWDAEGCFSSPRSAVNVPVNPLPTNVTPSAVSPTICNGSNTDIQIPSSQVGINYQLRNDAGDVNVGTVVAGNGGTITLPTGNLTGTTTFNVLATNTTTTCARELSTLVTITVYSNLTGGTFIYTNTTSCSSSNGTLTVTGVSGGSGTYGYSINSTNGTNGTWTNTTGSFTGVAAGSGQVWVRNTSVPYCPVQLGTYTIYEPYSPIATPTATNNLPDLCNGNIATLTASGLAPGNGGSNAANGARRFNGGQYLSSNTSAGLPTGSVATVEAWVKRNALADASYNGIVAWGPRACTNTSLLFSMKSDGRLSMATWCNDFVPSTGPAVPVSVWTHVAMVVNGTSVQFYINGEPAQSGTIASPNIQATTGQFLTIGCTDIYGRYFNGDIDNVRIWASARSQAELQADMHKEVPTNNVGALRALYTFNGGSLVNSSGPGPNLNAATATTVAPNYYTYTWSGGLPAGTAPAGANPASSTNEVQTSGTITGTSPFQVIATANGCASAQSNVAPSNDFAGSYTVTLEGAGTGNALAVVLPGNQNSAAYGRRQVPPATFAGLETGGITSGTWGRCVNWGLPTTSTSTHGPRIGWPLATTVMEYLTSVATNSTTDLPNGKVCYTAFLNPGTNKFCTNSACSAYLSSSSAIQFRLTITVLTTGGAPIPLDYVSSGHIVMRARQDFKVRTFLEVYSPSAQYYGASQSTGSGGTCNNYSTPNTWYPALEWYDCIYKSGAPQLAYSFNYNSFPKFNNIGVDIGPDLNVCPGATIDLVADDGSLTSTCGTLLHYWDGPAGFATGTLAAPTGSTTESVTAQSTPTNTYGTYHYTVSQSPSNICYDTDQLVVTSNAGVVDNVNFPSPPNITNITTHWKTTLDPLGDTGPDNWFDNDNWTHCVPDINTNAMIYQTVNPTNDPLYQPIILSPNAKASAIKIDTDNGAILRIDSDAGGRLEVAQ